ncbi:MAG: hypothetical protein ABW032_12630 [Burkholderiaceae bacterium]
MRRFAAESRFEREDLVPGENFDILANRFEMRPQNPLLTQDNPSMAAAQARLSGSFHFLAYDKPAAAREWIFDGESGQMRCVEARRPSHRCDNRRASSSFLAAQFRRVSREKSRAFLLLPPSLVRSGALRSDIYTLGAAARIAPGRVRGVRPRMARQPEGGLAACGSTAR